MPPPLPPRPPSHPSSPSIPPQARRSESSSPSPTLPPNELQPLLRRFTTSITSIQLTSSYSSLARHAERLDFIPASAEEVKWDPEKLRDAVERCYIGFGGDMRALIGQLKLVRSWEDPIRTGGWALAYTLAWHSRFGVLAWFFALLALLVLVPSSRSALFPPLPPSPSSIKKQQKVAEEPTKEAALTQTELEEQDAHLWAEEVAQLSAAAVGAELPASPDSPSTSTTTSPIDPTASPAEIDLGQKKPKKTNPKLAQHGLPLQLLANDLADSWSRWHCALSPTISPTSVRIKIALHILPCVLAFGVLPSWVINRLLGGLVGVGVFGGPGFGALIRSLDGRRPEWREEIELRYTMLAGVPSQNQLTIRLLREAEAVGRPLPPPPSLAVSNPTSPPPPTTTTEEDRDHDVDSLSSESGLSSSTTSSQPKSNKQKLSTFIRHTTSLTEKSSSYLSGQRQVNWRSLGEQAASRLAPGAGRDLAKGVVGLVPLSQREKEGGGEVMMMMSEEERNASTFYAHHHSTPGHLILSPPIHPTSLIFRPLGVGTASHPGLITIPLDSLLALRKTAGLGWKGRLVMGLATGLGGVGEGIKVRWKEEEGGEEREEHFGALVRRDELWLRICGAMKGRWEIL